MSIDPSLIQTVTALQALEMLDELEAAAIGDEPFNHFSAVGIRQYIESTLGAPQSNEIERLQKDAAIVDWLSSNPRLAEFTGIDGVTTDCVYYAVSGVPGLTLREIMESMIDAKRRKQL